MRAALRTTAPKSSLWKGQSTLSLRGNYSISLEYLQINQFSWDRCRLLARLLTGQARNAMFWFLEIRMSGLPLSLTLLTKKPKKGQVWCYTFSLLGKQVISSKCPQPSPSLPIPVTGLLSTQYLRQRGKYSTLSSFSTLYTTYLTLYLVDRQKVKGNKSSWPSKKLGKLIYNMYKYAWMWHFAGTLNTENRKYFCLRFCVCFLVLVPSLCPTVLKTRKEDAL